MRRNGWSNEQRLINVQLQEQQRKEAAALVHRDRQLLAGLQGEEGFERRRYVRQMRKELQERQMESAIQKAEDERIIRQMQIQQEERQANELARISHEKEREERIRQHFKENSTELRELEAKLRAAYLNKARSAQIAEHEVIRSEAMRSEADFARKMKSELEQANLEAKKQQKRHHEELLHYQQELDKQLMEREHKRQAAYEEFLKEKLLVDGIIRKIYEEDQVERQLKLEKVKATQQHIEEFKRQRAEWRHIEQEQMDAENRRILEYARRQQQKEENQKATNKEREEAKEKLHKMLAEKMDNERQQREDMERVREELYLEEQEEANRRRDIEEMERKIRQRLMMQQTCQQQLAFKEMQRQAEREEDAAFRRRMLAKYAEDDRIEQMNAQKRRMKQLEHRREVEKLIEERRQQHKADKELEAKEKALEEEKEALRMKIIEEERQKLLKQHAKQLLGYLPKGLLRADDLEYLDEDFRKNFQTRHADFLSEDGWEEDD